MMNCKSDEKRVFRLLFWALVVLWAISVAGLSACDGPAEFKWGIAHFLAGTAAVYVADKGGLI